MILSDQQRKLISDASKIVIMQAENPDGDSLGSATALEEILSDMGKTVYLQCPVQIPSYLHYVSGWDRVALDFPTGADMAIIVDTSSKTLMSKTLDDPAMLNFLSTHPVLVFDHHAGVDRDLPFDAQYIIDSAAVSAGQLILNTALEEGWPLSQTAAKNLYISIESDSLGLTTANTTPEAFEACATLMRHGVVPAEVEGERRELMKKTPRILEYKGRLLERVEYYNDGRTAYIHVPFDEIHEYSNEYNPTMLVIDEMRMVTGVDVAVGIKTYPDGKLTGKVRSNIPISNLVAKTFGGDGHAFAAGFRTYVDLDKFLPEFVHEMDKLYKEYDDNHSQAEADRAAEEAIAKAEKCAEKGQHASLNGAQLGGFKIRK